jgi:hypothetical protein
MAVGALLVRLPCQSTCAESIKPGVSYDNRLSNMSAGFLFSITTQLCSCLITGWPRSRSLLLSTAFSVSTALLRSLSRARRRRRRRSGHGAARLLSSTGMRPTARKGLLMQTCLTRSSFSYSSERKRSGTE